MEWIFLIVILIFSVILHEIAHGAMANYLGDSTAKDQGRLTLNPVFHLDFFGSILLPAFLIILSKLASGPGIIFGWAKPVPINPYNFRDKKYGEAKVALAGPLANLSLALVFGLFLRFFSASGIFPNLAFLFAYIVYINIILAVFNLLPIPPLDGSHILFTFLSRKLDNFKAFLYQYGTFILLFILFFFFGWIRVIAGFLFQLITGLALY